MSLMLLSSNKNAVSIITIIIIIINKENNIVMSSPNPFGVPFMLPKSKGSGTPQWRPPIEIQTITTPVRVRSGNFLSKGWAFIMSGLDLH